MSRFWSAGDRLLGRFLSFVAGASCIVCGRGGDLLCDGCAASLPVIGARRCSVCALPLDASPGNVCGACLADPPPFTHITAAFTYDPPATEMLVRGKYDGRLAYIDALISLALRVLDDEIVQLAGFDAIVPVPLSPRRALSRGYNQAFRISKALSHRTGVSVDAGVLVKNRDIPPQSGLSRQERRESVKNAFSLKKNLKHAKVILVDDVVTTTATVREAAGTLIKGGCDEIRVFALCRTRD